MSDAIDLIRAERERQVSEEGWTTEHDDEHLGYDLRLAAACYALPESERVRILEDDVYLHLRSLIWPWTEDYWKPTPDDPVRELVKAGALIVAEIERLQRKEPAHE